ncbi:MBL fold metallo-hydrolase [Halomicroarcula sp. GCM10025710]
MATGLGLFPPFASNAYLVDETALGDADGDLTLVDTGLWWNEPTIVDELAAVGYAPGDLDRVLITHYDLDHVGGLNRLVPEFDGPVYVGTADLDLLNGDSDPAWLHHKGLFHRVARQLFPLPDVDLYPVEDGDTVGRFTAHTTPGHNPGHVVYHHEDAAAAFLGDLVWEDDGALTTPIRFDSYDMVEPGPASSTSPRGFPRSRWPRWGTVTRSSPTGSRPSRRSLPSTDPLTCVGMAFYSPPVCQSI